MFIALHRRMTERNVHELEAVLAGEQPLEALWEFQSNWDQTALGVESIALSNHRKALRSELAHVTDDARKAQAAALERVVEHMNIDTAILPPVALTTILVALARTLANEERVGITRGHDEVRTFVKWALAKVASPKPN